MYESKTLRRWRKWTITDHIILFFLTKSRKPVAINTTGSRCHTEGVPRLNRITIIQERSLTKTGVSLVFKENKLVK